jgi:hypothetical protein
MTTSSQHPARQQISTTSADSTLLGDRKPCMIRSHRQGQMRIRCSVVEPLVRAMFDGGHDLPPGGGIGAELVDDQ